MTVLMSRRWALASAAATLVLPAVSLQASAENFGPRIAALESRNGGRIGVAALDTGNGQQLSHRGYERFAMCSTFKFLAAARVLSRVDRGEEKLDRRIVFSKNDLVTYSPATEKHVSGDGMSVAEICEAALTLSDNTAGNLMLASFGGPAGWTQYARSLGDAVSRLDRTETELNTAIPGDPRDTTTPAAMLSNMRKVLLDDALSAPSRERLTTWLMGNKTGDTRLRAGLPPDWRVGDKTGAGDNGANNDIAIAWPPGRAPVLVCVYFTESQRSMSERNAVHAEIGRMVASGL